MECRDIVTGNEFRYGCAQQFAWWLEPWSATLAGISLALLLFHIVQLVVTSKLSKSIRCYNAVHQENDYQYD